MENLNITPYPPDIQKKIDEDFKKLMETIDNKNSMVSIDNKNIKQNAGKTRKTRKNKKKKSHKKSKY